MARNFVTWAFALLLAMALPPTTSLIFAQDNDSDYESDDVGVPVGENELDFRDEDEPVALESLVEAAPEPVAIATDENPEDESSLDSYYGEATEDELADDPVATIEVIRERYPNRTIKTEREVKQDVYGNYINHGSWKTWDTQGNLIGKGEYRDGQRHGTWNRWHHRKNTKLLSSAPYNQYDSPFLSQAIFENDRLHGKWMIFDAKNRKVSSWEFADGERHGMSQWWYANGNAMRELSYVEGVSHGELLHWNVKGQVVARDKYENGRKLAPKVSTSRKGEKESEGMFLFAKISIKTPDDWENCIPATYARVGKDEKHGLWNAWYANGQLQVQGRFDHDTPGGIFTWWYSNGQKALQGEYRGGKQEGRWVWWHENGQKATVGSYVVGVQSGRWTQWKKNGQVMQAAEHSPDSEVVTEPSTSSREALRRSQSDNSLR